MRTNGSGHNDEGRPRATARRWARAGSLALLLAGVTACTFGPDYERPTAPVPTHYKELGTEPGTEPGGVVPAGWKRAAPAGAQAAGPWWTLFDDPVLTDLVARVAVSNQTLAASAAAYRQAVAVVASARATLYPTITLNGSVRRAESGTGGNTRNVGTAGATGSGGPTTLSVSSSSNIQTYYQPSIGASWDLDVWGRIRRTIESDVADAQASAADLAAATLSARAQLATAYFQLRAADTEKDLFDQAAAAYERSLAITRNQYAAGIATRGDVAQAETQLETTRSQAIAVGVQRAQLEHAIAVLIGVPPADLTIAPAPWSDAPPVIPAGVPSTLLERRPDIAAAERRVAAANASIGVAEAAYFPDITLTASLGYASTAMGSLFDAANRAWSVGAALAQTVFDAGARSAAVEQARAAYDQAVANYRQTVLTGFQGVEDQLAALRILKQQAATQAGAVASAREAERIELNQYKAGTVAYTSVVTAQQAALSNEQTALSIRQSRFTAAVALIQSLGGGWKAAELPAQIGSVLPRLY